MSFPAYPAYHDAVVPSLGIIPRHWDVVPLRRRVHIAEGQVDPEDIAFATLPLIAPNHVESGTGRLLGSESAAEQGAESGKYLCRAGDVIYSKIRPALRKVCIAPVESLCSADMYPLRAHSGLTNDFLYWLILSEQFSALAILESQRVAMPKINRESLKEMLLPVPPEEEQRAITSFLKGATLRLDALVVEQERLIALLMETRQAVISRTVTEGLNPDAPIKPSGVEWLGDVPAHWSIIPLKYACSLIRDGTHLPPARTDTGVPLLSVRNIVNGQFLLRDDDSLIDTKDYDELCRAFVPAEDDIVLAIVGATLGKTAIIPHGLPAFHIQRSLAVFRALPRIIAPGFLHAIFQSRGFQSLLWQQVGFSAQPGIYLGALQNVRIPVPPLSEQLDILRTSNARTTQLDCLSTEVECAKALLQERRAALISAAVTGKIDVRASGSREAAA